MISYNKTPPESWSKSLNDFGYFKGKLEFAQEFTDLIAAEDWKKLDQILLQETSKDGEIFKYMSQFLEFSEMEFIIAIRDAKNEWEEDGVWHDDGSRLLAFSMSLTLNPSQIDGGILELRKKGDIESLKIPTPELGNLVIFQTGENGWEHKINRVTKGTRIIMACWCS